MKTQQRKCIHSLFTAQKTLNCCVCDAGKICFQSSRKTHILPLFLHNNEMIVHIMCCVYGVRWENEDFTSNTHSMPGMDINMKIIWNYDHRFNPIPFPPQLKMMPKFMCWIFNECEKGRMKSNNGEKKWNKQSRKKRMKLIATVVFISVHTLFCCIISLKFLCSGKVFFYFPPPFILSFSAPCTLPYLIYFIQRKMYSEMGSCKKKKKLCRERSAHWEPDEIK